MRIDIITCCPELLESPLNHSIIQRAKNKGLCEIYVHNLRDWTLDKHRKVDDYAFGFGAGMVLQIEPIDRLITHLTSERHYDEIIFTAPDGERFDQKAANELSLKENLIILCGHYKGLIIEGFGSGGLPNTDDSLLEGLKQFLAEDGIAVFSTQVENEGSDLSVYEVGRIAQSLPGVVEGKDMTAEAIITKLMWALGQTDDVEICKQLFIRPIQFDRLVL